MPGLRPHLTPGRLPRRQPPAPGPARQAAGAICACLTHAIEALSPDPEVMTSEAIQTGLERCRKVKAEADAHGARL